MINLREALVKEIKTLEELELKSLRRAEEKRDFLIESFYRAQLINLRNSYKRVVKSLDDCSSVA